MTNFFTLNDGYIGYNINYRYTEFFDGRDNKSNYEANLKKLGPNWYYANAEISYIRNSLGHREKEPVDLDYDNYALCVGCSITEGIALEVDTRYSNILRERLKIDTYNMGLSGTGNDVIAHNLIVWLSKAVKTPKFVVIQ